MLYFQAGAASGISPARQTVAMSPRPGEAFVTEIRFDGSRSGGAGTVTYYYVDELLGLCGIEAEATSTGQGIIPDCPTCRWTHEVDLSNHHEILGDCRAILGFAASRIPNQKMGLGTIITMGGYFSALTVMHHQGGWEHLGHYPAYLDGSATVAGAIEGNLSTAAYDYWHPYSRHLYSLYY